MRIRLWSKRSILIALAFATACMIVLALLIRRDSFADRVTRDVQSGIPVGTPRATAEAWLTGHYGAFYGHYKGAELVGFQRPGMLLDAVAITGDIPGGVIIERVRKQTLPEKLMDRLHHEEVWVFLILDADENVQDYRFLPYDGLLAAQKAHAN